MSDANKPTPGPWEIDGDTVSSDAVVCIADCRLAIVRPGWAGTDYATAARCIDNVSLIAEAGTVFRETQCTPRQLVERVKELEKLLNIAVTQNEHDMQMTGEELRSARAALSKSLPNTVAEVK